MRARIGMVVAAATVALATPAIAATSGHSATVGSARPLAAHVGALQRAHAELLPVHGGTASSLNWAGYADVRGGIKGVLSQFVVPKATDLPPGFTATWAGVGGYNTDDLIQAGTAEDSIGGYYAWYEILPASESEITGCTGDTNCTVVPGDRMTIKIALTKANTWSVSIVNTGHWSWHTTLHYVSSESSAEWILEAPTVGEQTITANVHTGSFGATNEWWDGKTWHTIAAGDPTQIEMLSGLEARTSGLARGGMAFNVCTYTTSCATP